MTALLKLKHLSKLHINNTAISYIAVRNHWNKDFKPGPYPKTTAQRLAAAKRYGVSPEEYEPYPDDGMGFGDYPKLPAISAEHMDPFYPYDFPELKRNFCEPVHVEVDMYGEDRYDISGRPRYPLWKQCLAFFGVIFGSGAVYLFLERIPMFRPVLPKQYPEDGKKHYTFESE